MKSPLTIWIGVIAFVCVVILSVTVDAADRGPSFQPQWHSGQTWRVKAVYASPGNANTWSQPVLWEYTLAQSENSGVEDRFIYIDARCLGTMTSSARFTYRKNNFTLVSAEISNRVRGREKIKTLTFDGGSPVLTRQSPIPFDAPVFPVSPGITRDYKVVSRIDNFLKKESVIVQTVSVGPGGVSPLPEWTTGRSLFKVECRNKADGNRLFVQYWDAKLPWPVYGENENMKYWVDVK